MISTATVRERWASFLGSFVAVALGVAVVTVSALVLLSSAPRVPERLAGAPVLVRSPAGTQTPGVFAENPPWSPRAAEELRKRLGALPGVARAVADRSFYAQAAGTTQRKGERQGHPWSTAALASYGKGLTGRPPERRDEVVVDRALGVRPGARLTVRTARGPERLTVSGTLDGPGYYVTDSRAAELAGGVRVIGLVLEPGAGPARVAADARALTGDGKGASGTAGKAGTAGTAGTVLTGDGRDALAPRQDEMTRWIGGQVLTAMALLSAFVTVFTVASTFAFTVAQRRREFGLLRTVGATPRQLRRTVYGEALTVGACGAALGAVLGVVAAPATAALLTDVGFQPPGSELRVRLWVPLLAFLLGPLVALAGVWTSARRAARTPALEAMREGAADTRTMTRRRWSVGLAATAAGLGCAASTAFVDSDAMVLAGLGAAAGLTVGLTALIPALIGPVARVLTRPLAARPGATAMLVRANLLTAVRRTSATVAPVLATVAFAVLITSTVQTTMSADTAEQAAAVRASGAVMPDGAPGLPDATVARSGGTALLSSTVHGGQDGPGAPLAAAGVTSGWARVSSVPVPGGGEMVVSAQVAAARGWHKGRTGAVTFEDGRTERLRVAAVVDDAAAASGGAAYQLFVPRALMRAHDPSALADVAFVPPRTPAADAPAPGAGARKVAVAAYAASADEEEDRLVRIFTLLLVAMSAGYTAVATASTLLMATSDWARDLRLLRLSGATRRQVLLALAGETSCVVALGGALGLAVAAPALLGMVHGLRERLGIPVGLEVAWPWVGGSVVASLLLGLVATVVPAHRLLRVRPGAA